MNDHYLKLSIAIASGVDVTFVCNAQQEAECRQECAEDCAAHYDGRGCDCRKRDAGYCLATTWFNERDEPFADLYIGWPHELEQAPVKFEWVEDGWYGWKYEDDSGK